MIIENITAEDVKYFINETSISSIEKAGGLAKYLKMFPLARGSLKPV